jgi:prepilin-type N-terminal cleavage/methylation domain-containing protein
VNYLNHSVKFSKRGLTLIELLIAIALISILAAAFTCIKFPKKEDLVKCGPKEAIESLIRSARKIANRRGEEVRVHFLDKRAALYRGIPVGYSSVDCYIDDSDSDSNRKKSTEDFLDKTVKSVSSHFVIETPLFIVTDAHGKVLFDGDQVAYRILENLKSQNGPLVSEKSLAFWPGHISISTDSDRKYEWKAERGTNMSRSYFSVSPSGLCEEVGFRTENCPEYNHYFIVDPLSGFVIDTKEDASKSLKEFFERPHH